MPVLSSVTRLERRKSLIERHRLVSCRAAQVKLYRCFLFDCVEINRAAAVILKLLIAAQAVLACEGLPILASVAMEMSPAGHTLQSSSPS
jgi:hypothetical protein